MQQAFTINDISPTKVIYDNVNMGSTIIFNDGANTIWLGNDTTLSISNGFPLGPGSNKSWNADQPCYAICATGLTSSLRITDNDGALFDTANIAGQIISQGLADDIATALRIEGVPPIDNAQVLYDATNNVALNMTWNTPIIDASRYNSISIRHYETNGAAGSVTATRTMWVFCYADSGGVTAMNADVYSYLPSGGGVLITPSMLKGPYVQIYLAGLAVGAANATIQTTVVGSYRTTGQQSRVELLNSMARTFTNDDGDSGTWNATGAWPAGATDEYPVTYGGPATFGWNVGATSSQSYMYIYDQKTGVIIAAQSFPVSTTTQRGWLPINLPVHPIKFRFNNSTAANITCSFGLVMDGAR
jgi:hypothetical protein